MSHEARSQYEFADDPAAADEARDHARAHARGERLDLIARGIVSALTAQGLGLDEDRCHVIVFHVLADHLYGNAAVDGPGERHT
jgi:hypothetical protein